MIYPNSLFPSFDRVEKVPFKPLQYWRLDLGDVDVVASSALVGDARDNFRKVVPGNVGAAKFQHVILDPLARVP